MSKFMLVSLLLLATLVDHQVQGIRLIKGSLSTKLYKLHEAEKSDWRRRILGFGKTNPSEDNHGSESGSNRKVLLTKTTSKNGKNDHHHQENEPITKGQSSSHESLGGKQENFTVNTSSVAQHPPETVSDQYSDILGIAEMDYTLARRNPSIHN